MNKFVILAFCAVLFTSARAQSSFAEMAALSTMLRGSGGGSSSSSGGPLASLLGSGSGSGSSSSSSSSTLSALTSSGSNPLSALTGGRGMSSMGSMGSMGGAMMMGGAEMSHMMDFYLCGRMGMSMPICLMMMQQNM